jgi:hypothetical protein
MYSIPIIFSSCGWAPPSGVRAWVRAPAVGRTSERVVRQHAGITNEQRESRTGADGRGLEHGTGLGVLAGDRSSPCIAARGRLASTIDDLNNWNILFFNRSPVDFEKIQQGYISRLKAPTHEPRGFLRWKEHLLGSFFRTFIRRRCFGCQVYMHPLWKI